MWSYASTTSKAQHRLGTVKAPESFCALIISLDFYADRESLKTFQQRSSNFSFRSISFHSLEQTEWQHS